MTKQEHLETVTICILINTEQIEDTDNNNNHHHCQHVIKIKVNQSIMETKIKLNKILITNNSYNNNQPNIPIYPIF